jgi:hypothetical protein
MLKLSDTMKTMPCNMAKDIQIPVRDGSYYWLKGLRININPFDPTHPQRIERMICLKPIDYDRFFSSDLGVELQIRYRKNAGFSELTLVHNPKLRTAKEIKEQTELARIETSDHDLENQGKKDKMAASKGELRRAAEGK